MNITLSLKKFKDLLERAYDEGFDDGAYSEHLTLAYDKGFDSSACASSGHSSLDLDEDKGRNEFLESIVNEAIDLYHIPQLKG